MTTIHKSASKIGILEFPNGNRNTLHVGSNRNTGETIVWQQVAGRRAQRITGRNIATLLGEIEAALASGDGTRWIGEHNSAALEALRGAHSIPPARGTNRNRGRWR